MSLDLQQLPSGPFREFYEYWLSLKGDDQVPAVEAFDLLDIPHLVANVTILEVEGPRVKTRFSGTNVNEETGQDSTGLYLDDLPCVSDIEERALNCTKTEEPFFVPDHPVTWTSREFTSYSTLVVPLANAEGKVVQLVYLMTFREQPQKKEVEV